MRTIRWGELFPKRQGVGAGTGPAMPQDPGFESSEEFKARGWLQERLPALQLELAVKLRAALDRVRHCRTAVQRKL